MYLVIIVEFIQILYLYNKLKKAEKGENDDIGNIDDNKDSFDKYNLKLNESKIDEKPLLDSMPQEEIETTNIENDIKQENESKFDEDIERKVRTIWDEDRPNFLEDEVSDVEPKRRRGRKKIRELIQKNSKIK